MPIGFRQPGHCGDGLGRTDIRLGEQRLALQIRQFDDIPVHQRHPPHARADQRVGQHRAERADAHHQHRRRRQTGLAGVADLGKQGLSVVSLHRVTYHTG